VTHAWVYVLIRQGVLPVAALTKTGQRLFSRTDVLRVKDQRRAARETRRQKTVGA
jgi:hypothetical protein